MGYYYAIGASSIASHSSTSLTGWALFPFAALRNYTAIAFLGSQQRFAVSYAAFNISQLGQLSCCLMTDVLYCLLGPFLTGCLQGQI